MGLEDLARGKKGKEKKDAEHKYTLEELVGMGVAGFYAIPALLLREQHWYLSDEETGELGNAGGAFIKSLPQAKAKRVAELVARWGPGVGFATGLAVTMGQRIEHSIKLRAARKGSGRGDSVSEETGGRPSGNGGPRKAPASGEVDSGGVESPGPARHRITGLFDKGEG